MHEVVEVYRCPNTRSRLELRPGIGLVNEFGQVFRFLDRTSDVPNFLASDNPASTGSGFDAVTADKLNRSLEEHVDIERNATAWLMKTFKTSESEVRSELANKARIESGHRLLIVGCGYGAEIPYCLERAGELGRVFATDISAAMIGHAKRQPEFEAVEFSVCDAISLPFGDEYFDRVIQVGAINQVSDVRRALGEMLRVLKVGGQVLVCDEGIAAHLRHTEYAQGFMTNNPLWSAQPPLDLLPSSATSVELSYILGQCFYILRFERSEGLPDVDWNVPHLGYRGGTIRTRFSGQLEGVTPETKSAIERAAAVAGLSIHDWLEQTLRSALPESSLGEERHE